MFRSGLETQVHFRDIRLNIKGVGRRVYRPQGIPAAECPPFALVFDI